jgi:hypothetical protein
MYIKINERIINTEQVVEVKITPAREEIHTTTDELRSEYDYPRGDYLPARPLKVEIVTTTSTSTYDDGGDYPEFKHTDYHPYVITLKGEDAELFLGALPSYEVAREGV